MNPNNNKTCKWSKPNGLDLKKANYTYETCHVLIWIELNEMQALGRLTNEPTDYMNYHDMYYNAWMTSTKNGTWPKEVDGNMDVLMNHCIKKHGIRNQRIILNEYGSMSEMRPKTK